MLIESCANLKNYNTFGVVAYAPALVHIDQPSDVRQLLGDPEMGRSPKFVLGGGSNTLLTRDLNEVVLRVEIKGKRLIEACADAWIVEIGAGEVWHDVVQWTLANGWPGLENLALIPGTTGGAVVQNIGAYGVELADRFESLDAVDLVTGQSFSLNKAKCQFAYRHSIFKSLLSGKALVTHVRLRLPKLWQPVTDYRDLELALEARGQDKALSAHDIFDLVCDIRRSKLPDPAVIGNAGSFFKNPVVTPEQCHDIISRDPKLVFYELEDGSIKLAAGWLIDACGWRGKSIGEAGVYEKQALVLVNKGYASGAEILTLSKAIQESVYGRFGIMLEPEPVIL
ncbi:MAG: UDP-N-acetylmuramate dehydrogenase [Saezia sp.]